MSLSPEHANKALRRAREISADLSSAQPPVDIVSLGYNLGVRSIESRNMVHEGYVGRRSDGGLVIRYKRGNSHERNRFTIAHEIAHILIAEASGVDVMNGKHRRGFDFEEIVADQIAAELLMPELLVKQSIVGKRPCWNTVMKMRAQFRVSTTAMVRRVLELPGIVALLIQVDYPSHDRSWSFTCRSTRGLDVLFHKRPLEIVKELIVGFENGRSTSCDVEVGGMQLRFDCVGRRMAKNTKSSCWFLGWASIETRFDRGLPQ